MSTLKSYTKFCLSAAHNVTLITLTAEVRYVFYKLPIRRFSLEPRRLVPLTTEGRKSGTTGALHDWDQDRLCRGYAGWGVASRKVFSSSRQQRKRERIEIRSRSLSDPHQISFPDDVRRLERNAVTFGKKRYIKVIHLLPSP